MVIWKRNRKNIKKAAKAQVVDLMKLQNLHPERMEKAIKLAKEFEMEFDRAALLKVWEDWYIYGFYSKEELLDDAVLVNAKLDIHLGKVFRVEGEYFTIDEVDAWRGEVLAELLRKEPGVPDIPLEQVAKEISFLDTDRVLHLMQGHTNWVDSAREYAFIVTM